MLGPHTPWWEVCSRLLYFTLVERAAVSFEVFDPTYLTSCVSGDT